MKIVHPTALALIYQAIDVSAINFALDVSANVTSPVSVSGSMNPQHITTAVNFDAKGANMEVCPSGDCTNGKFMRLSVASLTECNANGTQVTTVNTFKPKFSDWTNITVQQVNGVAVSSTSFVSSVAVGLKTVSFNLTASIYQDTGYVKYGSQNLTVPAGALKFTVDISSWPFANPLNTLTLAVKLDAKGPNGANLGMPEKKLTLDVNTHVAIDRVDLGASMFMDAPTIVILDGSEANVTNSSVVMLDGDTLFEWVFPSFKSMLHYDPVLGDNNTTNSSTNSGGNSPDDDGTKAPHTSLANKVSLSSLATAGLVALAYNVF